jgi:ABC-type nitrate/sulfonate/bicarbonate transport system substrate-binding protein
MVLLLAAALTLSFVQGCSPKDSGVSGKSPTPAASGNGETSPTAAGAAETAYEPLKVRIGINTSSYGWPFFVARDTGIFEKYNINVTIDSFASGGETLDAVSLKNEDVGEAADYALAIRLAAGTNLRAVAYFGEALTDTSKLYVSDDAIKTPADLPGKRIGVKKGTVNEYTWAKLFENYNIDPDSVEEVNLSSDAELITAFGNGQIDALWVSDLFLDKLKELVSNPVSIGDGTLAGTSTKSFVVFSSDFIQNNKEGAARFLKAYGEAIDYIKSNTEASAKIIEKAVTVDYDTALADFKNYGWAVQFKQEEYDYLKGVSDWTIENGVAPSAYNLADYIDLEPLKAAYPDNVDVTLN